MKHAGLIIQNTQDFTGYRHELDALSILESGYQSIQLEEIIQDTMSVDDNVLRINDLKIPLAEYKRIFVYCIGKSAPRASKIVKEVLGDHMYKGISFGVTPSEVASMDEYVGTHPFPSNQNIDVSVRIVDELRDLQEDDLVLCLISGGGSSLLCMPHDLDCVAMSELTKYLMNQGASISELNTIRKHTSQIQGGHFARLAYPARVVSLLFSDVPGDNPSLIASGPTVRDDTTVADAEQVLRKYHIDQHPQLKHCILFETPKEEKYFSRVDNIIIMNNEIMLESMKKRACEIGYTADIVSRTLEGEVSQVATDILALTSNVSCQLYGGETTVNVVNAHGKGGRCQELALYALKHIDEHTIVLAASSDGRDNSDAAGALVSQRLLRRAEQEGLRVDDYLSSNTSFEYLEKIQGHIYTGQTGVNVSDVYMVLRFS